MTEADIVGNDIAKRVFQAHEIDTKGETRWTKKLSRARLDRFIREIPATIIVMETCGCAHH